MPVKNAYDYSPLVTFLSLTLPHAAPTAEPGSVFSTSYIQFVYIVFQMRSTTRKLQSVQQALWRLRYRVERNFDLLLEARELFWLELELRTELRTDQIRLVRGNSVSNVHYFLKNLLPITSFHISK